MGAKREGLEASQPQKAAGDSTVPIVRFHYIPPRLCLSFSLPLCLCPSLPLLPLIKSFPCLPHFHSKKWMVSKRPFFAEEYYCLASVTHARACTHTHTKSHESQCKART